MVNEALIWSVFVVIVIVYSINSCWHVGYHDTVSWSSLHKLCIGLHLSLLLWAHWS